MSIVTSDDRHPPMLAVANAVPAVSTPGARPMGDIPVVARLVLENGTEAWRIAAANRWTREQVLVIWRNDPENPYSSQSCWLAASDVARAITGPTNQLASTWAALPKGTAALIGDSWGVRPRARPGS